ncbi:tyrosinase family protein [Rhodanobacter sp. UC4451_H18]
MCVLLSGVDGHEHIGTRGCGKGNARLQRELDAQLHRRGACHCRCRGHRQRPVVLAALMGTSSSLQRAPFEGIYPTSWEGTGMNYLDQPSDMNRRVFVKGLGLVSLGLVTSAMFGGCEQLIKDIQNRPVRRYLRTGSPEVQHALDVYREAVIKMRALPDSDPCSWNAQAALHGTVSGGFNLCQHGTVHFFSWHRAYLLYFERICQQLTGEKSFGLPYWNWNRYPAMHPAFTAAGSALDHPRSNTTVGSNAAFNDPTMTTILSDANFITFSSQLEGTPHNTAHVIIGMDMGTGGSPQDPIFWAHHCMVDYCWAKWNIELHNDNPSDPTWINTTWNHFVDGNGNPVSISAGVTPLLPLLSYRYESSRVGDFATPLDMLRLSAQQAKLIEARIRKGAPVRFDIRRRVPIAANVTLRLDRPVSRQARLTTADLAALLESDARRERVFLNVDYAQQPQANDFFVRVFINLPDANAQTPTSDIHYAGSYAFFGTQATSDDSGDHTSHHHKTDFIIDVTQTLKRLHRNGVVRTDQPLAVQIVAVPAEGKFRQPAMPLMLKNVGFLIAPVHVRASDG